MSQCGLTIQQNQESGMINKKRAFKHGIALSTKAHAFRIKAVGSPWEALSAPNNEIQFFHECIFLNLDRE